MTDADRRCRWCGKEIPEGMLALGFDNCENPECEEKTMEVVREKLRRNPPRRFTHCACGMELDENGMCCYEEHNYW